VTAVALLFPGQGSQAPGMGRDLAAAHVEARDVFAEVDDALGMPLSRLAFEGSAEDLALTENTQPCILACSVAAWRVLQARGVRPSLLAGHSLGEYSALVAAGAIALADAARIARRRGRYMQDAVPVGRGAMAALLGLERADVEALCGQVRREGEVLSPANYNSPGQVVVAGHREAVERLVAMAAERGARRSVLLPVSAPFHCALMAPAAERLAVDLAALAIAPAAIPVVSNVDARERTDPAGLRAALQAQVVAPVLWEDSVRRLVELGASSFLEVGPGRVLSGLVKRVVPRTSRIAACGTPAEVAEALAAASA
jgi:[acyl-carrier-protein] S-malonyltransferase